jgi:hypothetical protein
MTPPALPNSDIAPCAPSGRTICRAILVVWIILSSVAPLPATGACTLDSIHVDIALGEISSHVGRGLGQTFIAPETVITRIRVWRNGLNQPNASSMKMWIVRVDPSIGRPLQDGVIQEGPVVQVIYGKPIPHTPIDFEFDPPVGLPSPGTYAFFVQQICDGFFSLMLSASDVYDGGIYWRTDRSQVAGCFLAGGDGFADYDMIFDVEFCSSKTTLVRRTSWGRVKTIYR